MSLLCCCCRDFCGGPAGASTEKLEIRSCTKISFGINPAVPRILLARRHLYKSRQVAAAAKRAGRKNKNVIKLQPLLPE